jgi:CheY-like chemotaxis protein
MLPTSLRHFSILYVEDEPLIAMDGEEMLREIGFSSIVVALTFDDALEAIRRQRFDLAVMDINLGSGRTSMPLAMELASRKTLLVFASGYNSAADGVTAKYGPRLEKPFDRKALLNAVMDATVAIR